MVNRLLLIIFILFSCSNLYSQDSIQKADSVFVGKATYYGKKFNGRKTASGERYSKNNYTAAHGNLPFKTRIKVVNTLNNKSVEVLVNDRCRRKKKNIVDLSYIAAKDIDMLSHGVVPITYQIIYTRDSIMGQDTLMKNVSIEK